MSYTYNPFTHNFDYYQPASSDPLTGFGDVTGPASATDNALARFDGTTGKLIQNSSASVTDSGQIRVSAGSDTAPAYSFSLDTNSGVYGSATGRIAIAASGTNGFEVQGDNQRNIAGFTHRAPIGSISNPSFGFTGDDNTGIFQSEANVLNFTTDGTERGSFRSTGEFRVENLTASRALVTDASKNLTSSATTATQLGYLSTTTSDVQTQLDSKQEAGNYITALTSDVTASGPGSVAATVVSVGGQTAADVAAGAVLANAATSANTANAIVRRGTSNEFTAGTITGVAFRANNGTAGVPTHTFSNDTTTGFYLPAAATVAATTSGTERFRLTTTVATLTLPLTVPAGVAATPSLNFSGFTTTGLYAPNANNISLTLSGTQTAALTTNGFLVPDGSASTAGLSFLNEGSTGLFRPGSGVLAFTTAGTERARFDNAGNAAIGTTSTRLSASSQAAGITTLTVFNVANGGGGLELGSDTTTNNATVGRIGYISNTNTAANKTIGYIDVIQTSTATNRGGNMRFYTKADNTSGAVRVTIESTGDLAVNTVGRGLKVAEGSNAKMGVATLVAGTVTVNTTAVSSTSRIFLAGQNSSGTHGELTISARSAATSFTITSVSASDTRDVAWMIVDPA